jgi:hypothetical protein
MNRMSRSSLVFAMTTAPCKGTREEHVILGGVYT